MRDAYFSLEATAYWGYRQKRKHPTVNKLLTSFSEGGNRILS
jgi:hypothetical protein